MAGRGNLSDFLRAAAPPTQVVLKVATIDSVCLNTSKTTPNTAFFFEEILLNIRCVNPKAVPFDFSIQENILAVT